ncbi:hypothetical protein HDU98_006688 [Podochytrium sp. JEL0797]|nr:hypothetical protein HDU98_006688 [Podochytrium sp. JEL0797]
MNRYVVAAGDTHYDIAQRHGLTLDQLYEMNPGLSHNAYGLETGSAVNVPLYTNGQHPPATCPPGPPSNNNQNNCNDKNGSNSNSNKTGAIMGGLLGAAALTSWKKNSDYHAQSNAPCFSQYQTSQGILQWRPVFPGQQFPQDAIALGRDSDGTNLYAARAALFGGWHIGKSNGRGGVYISYGGKEHKIKTSYEILCGNPRGVSVIHQSGVLNLEQLPSQPIDGGHEASGERLFVAIVDHKGSMQIGKCSAKNKAGCNFPYGGKEVADKNYRVVVII